MVAQSAPASPPSASFDTVVPHSAATARLPSPMQREHDKDRDTKSRRIVNISDITRIRLCCCIQKIYNMLTHVVEGYGTFYYNKHGHLLPQAQETVDKIMCLYHNQIEHRCIEVGLTVDEEREWDSDDANVDVDALSESGEESEEHDSDDICFYSEDDNDDVDNIDLSSEELKQRHIEHYLQLSDDDEKTEDVLIGKHKRK